VLPVLIFTVGLALLVFSSFHLWQIFRDNALAQEEYAVLRDIRMAILPDVVFDAEQTDTPSQEFIPEDAGDLMQELLALNPDFVGWIQIPGTAVDYPVVRGADNAQYLHTTFSGTYNPAGSIFMDYRAVDGFDTAVTILYGHNMRDGSMFAALHDYLEPGFVLRHPAITVVTVDGARLTYRIFDVRMTDAWDPAYMLDFGDSQAAADFFTTAPPGSNRFLVLSTCYGTSGPARVLVLAALTDALEV